MTYEIFQNGSLFDVRFYVNGRWTITEHGFADRGTAKDAGELGVKFYNMGKAA